MRLVVAVIVVVLAAALSFAKDDGRRESNPRAASEAFYAAIVAGEDEKAQGMSAEGEFPHGFDRLRQDLDMSKGRIDKVWADGKDACAVTAFIPMKARSGMFAFGLGLRKVGDRWIVRDLDAIPDQKAADDFVTKFRTSSPGSVEIPSAK